MGETLVKAIELRHYYFPWELEAALRDFVAYYNNERYPEHGPGRQPFSV